MIKVVKFGGSSLANAEQFRKVADIIRADEARKYIVPSAPGKRFSGDSKVTDLLYECYSSKKADFGRKLEEIKARYNEIIRDLELDLSLEKEFQTMEACFIGKAGRDYAASRGEYLNGIVLANYLGYEFIDAAEVIFFDEQGNFDADKTNKILAERLSTVECAVIQMIPSRPSQGVALILQARLWRERQGQICTKIGRMYPVSLSQIHALLMIRR